MKYTLVRLLLLSLAITSLFSRVEAQMAVHFSIVTAEPRSSVPGPKGTPHTPASPDVMFKAAEAWLSANPFDPLAAALLPAAEVNAKSIFSVPSLQFQRAATQHVLSGPQRGDVLLVEYTVQGPFGKGSVILDDTPYYSHYYFRLDGSNIASPAALTTFLDALLGWHPPAPPPAQSSGAPAPARTGIISLPFPEVLVPVNFPATPAFSGSRFSTSQHHFVADFEFVGLQVKTEWYLDFGVGKGAASKPVGVPWIPERFPPLSDLIKSWSFDQVRHEIGTEVKPFADVPAFTYGRDRLLIAELAKRGLSQDQVVDLLTDVDKTPEGYRQRLESVVSGFQAAGSGTFAALYFAPALQAYESIGPAADPSVASLFGQAVLRLGCPASVEAQAIDVLQKGVFFQGPLAYLSRCSASRDTLALLEKMGTPTEALARTKALAITQIRFRMEHSGQQAPKNAVPAVR